MTTCTYQGLQYAAGHRIRPYNNPTSIESIVDTACMVSMQNFKDVCGSRKRVHSDVRMIVIALIKEYNPKTSHEAIGKYLSRHHTTITYNLQTHAIYMSSDKKYKQKYNKIKGAL